jgi:hypothetical protein
MASSELLKAVAVTAELCGRVFSEGAARVFVSDLETYPEQAVLKALTRCRREVKGMLTIQDVVSRIDDGRLGVEEAWAMMPFSESQSVVWTEEMAEAFGVALPLLCEGEKVAARMAFKECYLRLIGAARDAGKPIVWLPSLGHDKSGREPVLNEAVAKGRLTYEHAQEIGYALPAPENNKVSLLMNSLVKKVTFN